MTPLKSFVIFGNILEVTTKWEENVGNMPAMIIPKKGYRPVRSLKRRRKVCQSVKFEFKQAGLISFAGRKEKAEENANCRQHWLHSCTSNK